jgi:hypothetical protein
MVMDLVGIVRLHTTLLVKSICRTLLQGSTNNVFHTEERTDQVRVALTYHMPWYALSCDICTNYPYRQSDKGFVDISSAGLLDVPLGWSRNFFTVLIAGLLGVPPEWSTHSTVCLGTSLSF